MQPLDDRPDDDSSDSGLRRDLAAFRASVGEDLAAALGARLQSIQLGDGDQLGDFRLLRELGRGGMGVVFEAEQVSVSGRRVAVKIMRGLLATEAARTRFAREVAVIGRLDHPNVVPILAADVHGGTPFYAMKLVDGQSLRDHLRDRSMAGDWRGLAAIVRDIARALQHGHENGVVHRDVKPGNILIDRDGRAMLLDYGLACILDEHSDLTISADAIGTPDYMAPEQVDRRLGGVSPRSDVYGLGATLYECLAGAAPFAASTRHETMARILRGEAANLRAKARQIPADLANICAMAMAREPARRYATAGALADDLDAFLVHRPVRARAPGPWRRVVGQLRRHRLVAAACGLVGAGFVSAATWWGWLRPAGIMAARLAVVDDAWQRRDALDHLIAERSEAEGALLARAPNLTLHEGLPARLLELRRYRDERARVDRELEDALDACVTLDPAHDGARRRHVAYLTRHLRDLLADGGIVQRTDEIARCEQRLRRFAAEADAEILAHTARLEVHCAGGPARVWLCPAYTAADGRVLYAEAESPTAVELGPTPVAATVSEGNHALRASRDGYVDIVLPLLVRRTAVQTPSERRVDLEFLTAQQIGEGYRQVHGGYGATADRSVEGWSAGEHLRYHAGFLMTEREVRLEDYLRWIDRAPTPEEQRRIDAGDSLIDQLDWGGILERLTELNASEQRRRTGRYVGLPTPEEWLRAGQGADGRPFPWGWLHDWRFSQNYWSTIDATMTPDRSRRPQEDCSPFGIRELAGSLREVCLPERPLREIGTKQFLVGGGSHLSTYAQALQLTAMQTIEHGDKAAGLGLRLVRRPLPSVPAGPTSLRLAETLAVPASAIGWRLAGVSGPLREEIDFAERCLACDGDLVVHGYAHWFSPNLICWHPVSLPTGQFAATIEFTCERTVAQRRSVDLRLGTQPGFDLHDRAYECRVTSDSWALHDGSGAAVRDAASAPDGARLRVHMEVIGSLLRAQLAVGDAAPRVLELPLTQPPPPLTYAAVVVPNLVGATVHVHDLAVATR